MTLGPEIPPDAHQAPEIDPANHCIECGEKALDMCQCCGRPLCSRHRETGGGFCQDFTSIETDLGQLPACIRAVGDEVHIDSNTRLLYGRDDKPDPDEVTREDLEAAVRDALPGVVYERAREHLANVIDDTDDDEIAEGAAELRADLTHIAEGGLDPDHLNAVITGLDGLVKRVERAADDDTDLEIENWFTVGLELDLAATEIERVRGTDLLLEDGRTEGSADA